MSTNDVEEFWNLGVIADHWRALKLQDVLMRFSLEQEEMDEISMLTRREGSDEPQCNSADCENGMFYGHRCKEPGRKCAVLLSSYPGKTLLSLIV